LRTRRGIDRRKGGRVIRSAVSPRASCAESHSHERAGKRDRCFARAVTRLGRHKGHAERFYERSRVRRSVTCKLGICLSRNLLTAVYEASEDSAPATPKLPDDLSIRISGCSNSCGQHALADIGFAGTAKRSGERQYPAYTLYAGADINGRNPALGKKLGVVPARRIPDFLNALFGFIAETRKSGEQWASFVTRKEADIRGLALRSDLSRKAKRTATFTGTGEPTSLSLSRKDPRESARQASWTSSSTISGAHARRS